MSKQSEKEHRADLSAALSCSICLENYDLQSRTPQILPCFHTFCACCLDALSKNQSQLKCPTCQGTFAKSKWSPNFALTELLGQKQQLLTEAHPMCICDSRAATGRCADCGDFLCDVEAKIHLKSQVSKDHRIIPLSELASAEPLPVYKCTLHGLDFRYICTVEDQLLCVDCFAIDHHGHKCKSLADSAEEERKDAETMLKASKAEQKGIDKKMSRIGMIKKEIGELETSLASAIKLEMQRVRELLDAREKKLLEELSHVSNNKIKLLDQQLQTLKNSQTRIHSACDQLQKVINSSNSVQISVTKRQVQAAISKIPLPSPQDVSAKLEVVIDAQHVEKAILSLGIIQAQALTSAPRSFIKPEVDPHVVTGPSAGFTLQACDSGGKPRLQGGDVWKLQIEGIPQADYKVVDNNNGTYSFEYKVPDGSNFRVSVTLEDKHIKGSPFDVMRHIGRFAGSWTISSSGTPKGLATDGKSIFVCDSANNRVKMFNLFGKHLGDYPGTFNQPQAIVIVPGKMIVADFKRVQIFSHDTNKKLVFEAKINGIAASKECFYVCYNREIRAYAHGSLTQEYRWTIPGDVEKFSYGGMCFHDKYLYVCDSRSSRVLIFDHRGDYITSIDGIDFPYVVSAHKNSLYVGAQGGSIHVFEIGTGKRLGVIGSGKGSENGKFFGKILGIAVAENFVYASDHGNSRVQVFKP